MGKVILKDFEVMARHGVNPEEKINPQRFLFTAVVDCDFVTASKDDDVDKTVSYSAVKKVIKSVCEQNCFDLIETLASRCASKILHEFPLAKGVTLTVKKPDAPMSGNFDYVAVELSLAWHEVYLALGSSMGDKQGYLDFAIERLTTDKNVKDVKESKRLVSAPYGGVAKEQFVNSCVKCFTIYSPDELLKVINQIEADGDRVREEHWGDRTLDIDVIFYGDEVIGNDTLAIPHPDMQHRAFVLEPLQELCKNKVHPLLKKRVSELYLELVTTKK